MIHYTYAHYKPDGGLFYIGKGSTKTNRAYSFKNRNRFWKNIVKKYGTPEVKILAHWGTEKEAFEHEKLLISCFKDMGFVLANITAGGEGTSGMKHSEEVKQRISMLNKGRVPTAEQIEKIRKSSTGRKHTEETLIKMGIAQKGNTNGKGNLGNKHSEETKNKISQKTLGRKMSDEHRAIISATHKGKKQSAEQIEKRIKSRMATVAAKKLNLINKGI